MSKGLRRLLVIVASAMIVFGFRFVTQAGLTGPAGTIQNDGYVVSGGLLILIGGFADGYIIARAKQN